MIEKFFKLKERKTTTKTEIVAGLTTFMSVAYILAVNPDILASANMDMQATLISTALMSAFGCIVMGLLANYPLVISASLGLNTLFAYTICRTMGFNWQFAVLCVFVEGILYTILTLTKISEKIFFAIPTMLKIGISVGIGIFIAFTGLKNAGITVESSATIISMIPFSDGDADKNIAAVLAFFGLLMIGILEHKKVKGSFIIAMITVWIIGIILQYTGVYNGKSLIPSFGNFDLTSGFDIMFAFASPEAFANFNTVAFVLIVFSMLLIHIFGTMGSVIATLRRPEFTDKDGNIKDVNKTLLADSLTSCASGIFGCSTPTVFVESVSGISAGGRTGLTAITAGILFFLSIFISPIFIAIPSFATAPVMMYIGFLMLSSIKEIDFTNIPEALPAAIAILFIPLTYSITEGIACGIVSYCVINVLTGKAKKISPYIYLFSILFILKLILI